MKRTSTFYLKKIFGLKLEDVASIQSHLFSGFDNSLGFGFIDTEVSQDRIQSTLVYATKIKRTVFDVEQQNFISKEEENFFKVKFSLRLNDYSLKIYSGGSRLIRLISTLEKISPSDVGCSDIHLNLAELINKKNLLSKSHRITGLKIEKFQPKLGVSGLFIASLEDPEIAKEMLDKYGHDIAEIQLYHETTFQSGTWVLSSKGKFCITTDEENIANQEEQIQDLIMELFNG